MAVAKNLILFLVCSLLTLALACGSPYKGQIVFVSEQDGGYDIFLLDEDAAEASQLTRNAGQDTAPRWSPKGEKIIYLSDESGDLQLYQLDLKEQTVAQVTNSPGLESPPVWSPDGQRFMFTSRQGGNTELFWTTTDGLGPTRVTDNDLNERLGDWSANGQWVVFYVEDQPEKRGLWLRNPDGVNLVRLTTGADTNPVWSPDGMRIAFVREHQGNTDIYVVKRSNDNTWLDPVEEFRLTQGLGEDSAPDWSPDGKALMFVSYRDGNAEIYVVRADGSQPVRLTNNAADDLEPVWSPDGKSIAFVSRIYGPGEIFVMAADGTGQRRLTNNQALDLAPDW